MEAARMEGIVETMGGASARFSDDLNAEPSRSVLLADATALVAYLTDRLIPPPLAVGPSGATSDEAQREAQAEAQAEEPDDAVARALALDPRFRGVTPRRAAVLAPLYARDGLPHLLFTRRAATLSKHSGEISFPGGSRDSADGSLAQTALRETHEELGLDPAQVTLLGALPPAYTVVSNFLVTPYIGWLGEGLPTLRPQVAEVAEVIEAPLSALDDLLIYHEETWTRGGQAHTVHFYDFGPYRIWGFTGRLLNGLLALLPSRP